MAEYDDDYEYNCEGFQETADYYLTNLSRELQRYADEEESDYGIDLGIAQNAKNIIDWLIADGDTESGGGVAWIETKKDCEAIADGLENIMLAYYEVYRAIKDAFQGMPNPRM